MADLPEFTIDGEHEDHEWRRVAAKPVRTEAEQRRYEAGPNAHPYGAAGHHKVIDGVGYWFPDKATATEYAKRLKADEPQPAASEPEKPLQVEASKKGREQAPSSPVNGPV